MSEQDRQRKIMEDRDRNREEIRITVEEELARLNVTRVEGEWQLMGDKEGYKEDGPLD